MSGRRDYTASNYARDRPADPPPPKSYERVTERRAERESARADRERTRPDTGRETVSSSYTRTERIAPSESVSSSYTRTERTAPTSRSTNDRPFAASGRYDRDDSKSTYTSRDEKKDRTANLGMDRVNQAKEGPKAAPVSYTEKYSGLVKAQERTYTTRLDDRPSVSVTSRGRGGFKPKSQKEHERQLDGINKGLNDLKKTNERDADRKTKDFERSWKEDERKLTEAVRKAEQWEKKVERETKDFERSHADTQRVTADKEETRVQRQADLEARFEERSEATVANHLAKKIQKHDRWEQKIAKRIARNEISESKRENRLKNRATAKEERLAAEKKDTIVRRGRRREHFLLSYQSTWDESKLEVNYEGSNYVAEDIKLQVGKFVLGDTRNLDTGGNRILQDKPVDAFEEEEQKLLNSISLEPEDCDDETAALWAEMEREERERAGAAQNKPDDDDELEPEAELEPNDETDARTMAELEAEAALAEEEALARELAELEAEEAALGL